MKTPYKSMLPAPAHFRLSVSMDVREIPYLLLEFFLFKLRQGAAHLGPNMVGQLSILGQHHS